MKTKDQIKTTLEIFAVRAGKFQYSNPNRTFGGGGVVPDPVFVQQLQNLFKEILPTAEEISDLAKGTRFSRKRNDQYAGFVQGARCIVKLMTD